MRDGRRRILKDSAIKVEQTIIVQTTGKDESGLVTVSLTSSEDYNIATPIPVPLSLLTSVFSFLYFRQSVESVPGRRFQGFLHFI